MDEPFQTLLNAAILAPSGDNTQPWRFVVDSSSKRIFLYVDETRDPSPMNASQCMARLAIGAALENMVRVAEGNRWNVSLESPSKGAAAVLKVNEARPGPGTIDPVIVNRVTNRRRYDGCSITAEQIAGVQDCGNALDGVRVCWVYERQPLYSLASLMGRSDGLMLAEPSMRQAFLENVRFDLPANAQAEEYLPVGSLELPWADRTALRFLPYIPNWILRLAKWKFAMAARRLAQSAAGVCFVVTNDNAPETDLLAGRLLQRLWLTLNANGWAVQPMMSLAILENVLRHGDERLLHSLGHAAAQATVEELRRQVPAISSGRVVFIMRFGHALPPSTRTGRRCLESCVTASQYSNVE